MSELVADYVASLCTCISAAGLRQLLTVKTRFRIKTCAEACRSFEYAEWWQCIARCAYAAKNVTARSCTGSDKASNSICLSWSD